MVIVDGEEALTDLAAVVWPDVRVQRCGFHLARATSFIAPTHELVDAATADDLVARLRTLLASAYQHGDAARARAAYRSLIGHARAVGAYKAAAHLHTAQHDALTFVYHPTAGRLVFGDKGRPELGTGVLERVMRELNRRTDNGVRCSIEGLRRLLMLKLQHNYQHGPWSPTVTSPTTPAVCFSLAA